MTEKSNQMWGGRFKVSPSQIMQKINQSISFDKKLYRQDIKGSIAHASMLGKTGIITKEEAKQIIQGLEQVEKEITAGSFVFKEELEDIHMNIEARLRQIIGDTAGKLHTARSRNDQVVTDLKLYIRDAFDEIDLLLKDLQRNLVNKARENIQTIMPGFTHLQTAQPVSFAHHLMAYFEMIKRDRSRIADSRKRMNQCPLGAAALAGTSFAIDRFETAKALDFDAPTSNSLDSVSDRDFVAEFIFDLSLLAVHLSRFAEEIVVWVSKGFGFIELTDAFTSGSSIMPQKRNPDAAELIRAKTGRLFGHLINILTVIKGLPLAYSKDMQEDKEPVFDAYENIKIAILAISGMVEDLKVNKDNMFKMSQSGFSTATDLADWLVKNLNIPFRDSHHITGMIVKLAEEKGCDLSDLSLKEIQNIEPRINNDIYKVLTVENSVKSRTSFGGTAFERVKQAVTEAAKELL